MVHSTLSICTHHRCTVIKLSSCFTDLIFTKMFYCAIYLKVKDTNLSTHVLNSTERRFKMDPSLLRERELFKKRALAVPVVEKRKTTKDSDKAKPPKKQKVTETKPKGEKLRQYTETYI